MEMSNSRRSPTLRATTSASFGRDAAVSSFSLRRNSVSLAAPSGWSLSRNLMHSIKSSMNSARPASVSFLPAMSSSRVGSLAAALEKVPGVVLFFYPLVSITGDERGEGFTKPFDTTWPALMPSIFLWDTVSSSLPTSP